MNNFPRKETVQYLREQYPVRCRVALDSMDDPHAPPIGTQGSVICVDSIGTIHVAWDNGSTLGVCYGEDHCHRI